MPKDAVKIISKNRTRNLVTPREICMYLMRELLDITFSEIGTTFSRRILCFTVICA